MNKKFKIKTGDTVIVIAGKDKGKTGNVSSVIKAHDRVVVDGVNMVKIHRKATQESPGKIEEKESSIHISNVAHLDPENGKATRVRYEFKNGIKSRLSVSSGSSLDKWFGVQYEYSFARNIWKRNCQTFKW